MTIRRSDLTAAVGRWKSTVRRGKTLLDGDTGEYEYIPETGQYRNKRTGKIITIAALRALLDQYLDAQSRRMAQITERLRSGEISEQEWYAEMERETRIAQIVGSALAVGGISALEQDTTQAEERIQWHLGKLALFFAALVAGAPIDGRTVRRAMLYAQAGRPTYHGILQGILRLQGYDQERSVLDPDAHHCQDCIDQAAIGWQPIGQMIPLGKRQCGVNDRCTVEYRNSATGKVVR